MKEFPNVKMKNEGVRLPTSPEMPVFCIALPEVRPDLYVSEVVSQLVFNQASRNTRETPEEHACKAHKKKLSAHPV